MQTGSVKIARRFIQRLLCRLRLKGKIFISIGAVMITVGCSKESPPAANNSEAVGLLKSPTVEVPKPIDPSQIVIVETTERKERLAIQAKAAAFLAAKDFAALEKLANDYRTSRECYPSGLWKLRSVYAGTRPGDDRPDAEWDSNLSVLRDWAGAKPDSITARVALADALVSYAWKARGIGLANTVSQTGWKLFGNRLSEAVEVLKEAGTLKEKCPYCLTVSLTAGLGTGMDRSQYDALFQKAITSEPDCIDYYCVMSEYLLPRWYGRQGELEEFIRKAADQVGGDAGNVFYARLVWYTQSMGGNIFVDDGISWERADRGFQVIEKQFPDSLYVQNARAYIAVMGCEKTLAPRRLVDGLHGKIDAAAWKSKENFIRLTRNLYPK